MAACNENLLQAWLACVGLIECCRTHECEQCQCRSSLDRRPASCMHGQGQPSVPNVICMWPINYAWCDNFSWAIMNRTRPRSVRPCNSGLTITWPCMAILMAVWEACRSLFRFASGFHQSTLRNKPSCNSGCSTRLACWVTLRSMNDCRQNSSARLACQLRLVMTLVFGIHLLMLSLSTFYYMRARVCIYNVTHRYTSVSTVMHVRFSTHL